MTDITDRLETEKSELSFDDMAERFTQRLRYAADWQENYFGASYASRIKQAVAELHTAIAEVGLDPTIGPFPQTDKVPMPQNADQAAGFVLLGHAWLKEYAPERLASTKPSDSGSSGWQLSDAKCHHDNGKHTDPPCVFVYFPDGCNCSPAQHQWLCAQHWYSARNCAHELLIDLRPAPARDSGA